MVRIEIDGIPLKVDSSKMIIQAADEAGIDIPRFCYHKKLSIAANCRMCLVEVDKSRKALPACATPVTEGMKVFTSSAVAREAQRGVMEFLLINHPLDCPICDQGGECELQDLSVGYGAGISRFNEGKRVVKDKHIGPLVQTEMTRCIHCTRCVRFGQEIAGIKELGAVGRGEHMEIGTYVEHSLTSELSGNIIDLCPVGALTSKPFRYKARAWEMSSYPSIAPHDAVGSNIELHVRGQDVLRVVPRENEAINETWISDRDRFSYLGLKHPDRLLQPMIKQQGEWQVTDWQTALEFAVEGLQSVIEKQGAKLIAGVMSPTATLEEGYLFQKWLRGLGAQHLDYRLRQQDFRDVSNGNHAAITLSDIQNIDAALLIGSNIRAEAPIIAHRLRQAALNGALINDLNFFSRDLLMPVQRQLALNPARLLETLKGIAKALVLLGKVPDPEWAGLLSDVEVSAIEQNIATQLDNASQGLLIVGAMANQHPEASRIRTLAGYIASLTGNQLLILPEANANALTVAGVLPTERAFDAQQIWQEKLRGYVLFNIDPEFDTANPRQSVDALKSADFVVSINGFDSPVLRNVADVMLPLALFAETSGTFVGVDGQWQSFTGVVAPRGESRPGWKILRVLGNLSGLTEFDYVASSDIQLEVQDLQANVNENSAPAYVPDSLSTSESLTLISEVPAYRTDDLLRHSEALQLTPENQGLEIARLNGEEAERFNLTNGDIITLQQDNVSIDVQIALDNAIASGCIYLATTTVLSAQLGAAFSSVTLESVMELVDV